MTEVLHSPSHFPSSPSSSSSLSYAPTTNDVSLHTQTQSQTQTQTQSLNNNGNSLTTSSSSSSVDEEDDQELKDSDKEEDQLSLLALLITAFRKSMVACSTETEDKLRSMEIGWPTNVRHVAHVTFDRFNGFLGLPVEFEPEVPRRAPSASANVFGVSTESMQCSYDCRGNSVPTILLLMQRRLYSQGGLQAEGIFRINAENGQEEHVRDQLNRGVVADDVDMHCLAGLIKAWFRELPSGVLDPLDPEQVMQCQTEEECSQLVRLLPPTEAALLDWAINLMADVAQEEVHNKMNARNIAMVFAPNMTQMVDPLTALMYAVQVMNFLKTLIVKTLKEREDSLVEPSASHLEPSNENGHESPSQLCPKEGASQDKEESEHVYVTNEPALESPPRPAEGHDPQIKRGSQGSQISIEDIMNDDDESSDDDSSSEISSQTNFVKAGVETGINGLKSASEEKRRRTKTGQSSKAGLPRKPISLSGPPVLPAVGASEKARGNSIVSRINSRMERVEAWR